MWGVVGLQTLTRRSNALLRCCCTSRPTRERVRASEGPPQPLRTPAKRARHLLPPCLSMTRLCTLRLVRATRISAVPTLLERLRAIFASAARCATATASWAVAAATFMASEKVRGRPHASNTCPNCPTLTDSLASATLVWPCFLPRRCVYMRMVAGGGVQQVPRAPPVAGAADCGRGTTLCSRRGRLCACRRVCIASVMPRTPRAVCNVMRDVRAVGPDGLRCWSRRPGGGQAVPCGRAGAGCTPAGAPAPP